MPMKTTAEQNPRSTQVNIEFSRMFFAEESRAKEEISTWEKKGRVVRVAGMKSWPSDGTEGRE